MICFDDLPSDPLLLKQKLVEIAAMVEALSAEKIALAGERDVALAQREATLQENEKLLLLLSQFKRMLFGRRSEKVDPDQLHFLLSEAESGVAAANENEAPGQADGDDKRAASARSSRSSANRNRGRLPLHLPRVDVVIDIDDKSCPCCGGEMHKIGETVKEMFDVVPVQYRVKRIIRPRYGCRARARSCKRRHLCKRSTVAWSQKLSSRMSRR
jgi:transposase